MLLRRISKHVKDQNWFAVGLDFVIVVIGVFFGIQIGNWNDARLDHLAYQKAHTRMVVEVRTNIALAEGVLEKAAPIMENFRHAIEDIRSCRNDPEAKARIDEAIEGLDSTLAYKLQNSAILQLTTSERLLERQSIERLEQYANYARRVDTAIDWSEKVLDKMEGRSDNLHPFVDYGELRGSSADRIIGSRRPLVLSVDPSEACRDDAFRKMLYIWEGGHSYQIDLLEAYIDVSEAFLEELGEPLEAD